ncbi:hypothetical protein NDN08_003785 [Rhodosorus marinus]|uniref:Nudix hydrolase domain-containing protein n=1 Tax=Rhodosorus marinus TaxID=101924 RepID=A0AAV8UJQ5_9RHOD|nr:hypothetical protein NDN08_003785 [Rhodosorus marinus]
MMAVADAETELLDVVDKFNNVLRQELRGVVHRHGLLHRAVHVVVFNSTEQLLLQRRSAMKKLGPNCWDLSCAEHLMVGESYAKAALRGLHEELNINKPECDLQLWEPMLQLMDYPEVDVKDNEFIAMFATLYDGEVIEDKVEVAETRWCTIEELQVEMKQSPDSFTPWFRKDYDKLNLESIIEQLKMKRARTPVLV